MTRVGGKAVATDANEVLIDGTLYDVSGFKHPGGSIIKFLKGNGDATDAFTEFHSRSKSANNYLKTLPSRKAPRDVIDRRANNGAGDSKDVR